MSQFPALPLWCADFFAKTDHLSNEEQWAYLKLMMKTWVRNCRPLDDNPQDIARLLGISQKRWLKMRHRLAPFFDLSDATWRQLRLEKEFQFVANRKAVSARNGARGGRPKTMQSNGLENPTGSSQGGPIESTHTHTHTQLESFSEPNGSTKDKRVGSVDREFELWWQGYPHKVGKGGARSKFLIARRKTSLDELIEGVKRYIASKPKDRAWCHPGTWLNQERWLDEPATADDLDESSIEKWGYDPKYHKHLFDPPSGERH